MLFGREAVPEDYEQIEDGWITNPNGIYHPYTINNTITLLPRRLEQLTILDCGMAICGFLLTLIASPWNLAHLRELLIRFRQPMVFGGDFPLGARIYLRHTIQRLKAARNKKIQYLDVHAGISAEYPFPTKRPNPLAKKS
jgi:hypothetical protein